MRVSGVFLILLQISILCVPATPHVCIHDSVMKKVLPHGKRNAMSMDQQYGGQFPDDTNTQPLRILLYDFIDNDVGGTCYHVGDVVTISSTQQYICQQEDILTAVNKQYLKHTLLPEAQQLLQRAFKVMPVVSLCLVYICC